MGYLLAAMAIGCGLIVSLLIRRVMSTAVREQSRMMTASGITAIAAADLMLKQAGNENVRIVSANGKLTDHFDPDDNTIYLSEETVLARDVASISIAAHEAGHAMQKHSGSWLLPLRYFKLFPVRKTAGLAWILLPAGLILSSGSMMWIGAGLFLVSIMTVLVILPVEMNASRIGIALMDRCGLFTEDEFRGAKKVLCAASMTHVLPVFMGPLVVLQKLRRCFFPAA